MGLYEHTLKEWKDFLNCQFTIKLCLLDEDTDNLIETVVVSKTDNRFDEAQVDSVSIENGELTLQITWHDSQYEDIINEAFNKPYKQKSKKNKGKGWFVNPNAGNPEYNASFFNSTFSSADGSNSVLSSATSSTGGGVSGGMGENFKTNTTSKILEETFSEEEENALKYYKELESSYNTLEKEYDSITNNFYKEMELSDKLTELSDEMEDWKVKWGYLLDRS